MEIEATDRAREFIAEKGGSVYVWSDDSGFDHASTERPDLAIEFLPIEADGFTFYQDTRIVSPDWWRIEFHHLPHQHITATWDDGVFGPPGVLGYAP